MKNSLKVVGGILVGSLLTFGAVATAQPKNKKDGATPEVEKATTTAVCAQAFQSPLYDTPSGYLENGYYDATKSIQIPVTSSTSTPPKQPMAARKVGGVGAWKRCKDVNGYWYDFRISNEEYAGYAHSLIPNQQVLSTTTKK